MCTPWGCVWVLAGTDVYRACVHTWGCVLILAQMSVYRRCVHTWGCVLVLFCKWRIHGPLRRAALCLCRVRQWPLGRGLRLRKLHSSVLRFQILPLQVLGPPQDQTSEPANCKLQERSNASSVGKTKTTGIIFPHDPVVKPLDTPADRFSYYKIHTN